MVASHTLGAYYGSSMGVGVQSVRGPNSEAAGRHLGAQLRYGRRIGAAPEAGGRTFGAEAW